jgi:hypothetical protein
MGSRVCSSTFVAPGLGLDEQVAQAGPHLEQSEAIGWPSVGPQPRLDSVEIAGGSVTLQSIGVVSVTQVVRFGLVPDEVRVGVDLRQFVLGRLRVPHQQPAFAATNDRRALVGELVD